MVVNLEPYQNFKGALASNLNRFVFAIEGYEVYSVLVILKLLAVGVTIKVENTYLTVPIQPDCHDSEVPYCHH